MSWQNQTALIVRNLVDDPTGATYGDARIEEVILVAAYLVRSEISFDTDYTVDVDGCTITPTPNTDVDFLSLTSYKAACIILRSEAKTQANSAISMTDGPSSISLKGVYEALKAEADGVCEKYENAKTQFTMSGSVGGLAILSPYSPGSHDVSSHGDHNDYGGSFFE